MECTDPDQCSSQNCVDGVCCDGLCNGVCEACSAAKKSAGLDGYCGPVANNDDPDNECAAMIPSSCGQDGFCNGSGACRLYGREAVCRRGSCSTATLAVLDDTCSGDGACMDNDTQDCQPYRCSSGACPVTCTSSTECVSTHYCNGATCELKLGPGAECGLGEECDTGNCVDGVCCDSSCSGQCERCDGMFTANGVSGMCDYVQSADPDGECGNRVCCGGSCKDPDQPVCFAQ